MEYEPTQVLIAMRMMLVGVDTFSLTRNRRQSTEKELKICKLKSALS